MLCLQSNGSGSFFLQKFINFVEHYCNFTVFFSLERERETERQRDRETERDRERQRETERQRDRDRETERVLFLKYTKIPPPWAFLSCW